MTEPAATVFVRGSDPTCQAVLRFLDERKVAYEVKDVNSDPSASAILFGRLGKVAVPAVLAGSRMLVGYDPVQLARFFPAADAAHEDKVSFGAAVRSVSDEVARATGLPSTYGVEVGTVTQGSPADIAGVKTGDVIVAIGAYTLQDANQFRQAITARHLGDVMNISVWRDGHQHDLTVAFPN